ncbi:MAG TPA: hypothetical protein VLV86_24090 [Vicinamibacterales bacterium]|nr:hypothetical protein [Vicinamibacterales bacterium]
MTQTPKQWAATGFIIGAAAGIAAAFIFFFFARNDANAAPQPQLSATTISGTIEANVKGPAIVFVIARDESHKGHPVLAKRLDVTSFPVKFSLGPEDVMMGGVPPARVFLEARIDRDGDAATREPGSPSASIDGVAMGASNLVLRLK